MTCAPVYTTSSKKTAADFTAISAGLADELAKVSRFTRNKDAKAKAKAKSREDWADVKDDGGGEPSV